MHNDVNSSLQELTLPMFGLLRDVPRCDALAGAVPCELVDFRQLKTSREFYDRFDTIYQVRLHL